MKRVIVTGGAGLIGSHLCSMLLSKGHEVICVDNFLTGSRELINVHKNNARFTLIEHDVVKPLHNTFDKIDWIFHLASPASPNYHSPISYHSLPMETMMVNTVGTHNMLELALSQNARFLFSSTSEIYGDPLEHPQKETYCGNVSSTGPRSIYDEAKRFGETLTAYYFREKKLDGRIARIFNTYGPGMRKEDKRMLVNFILQSLTNEPITIYGDGTQTRSLCYVEDTCKALYTFMEKDALRGEIINIGSENEHTVKEYAEVVLHTTHSHSTIQYEKAIKDDPQRRKPDISKAKMLLQWKPTTTIQDGITKTVAYYKNSV